jgi:hypothetical protein
MSPTNICRVLLCGSEEKYDISYGIWYAFGV